MKLADVLLLEKSPLAYRPRYDSEKKAVLGAAEDWAKGMGLTTEMIGHNSTFLS